MAAKDVLAAIDATILQIVTKGYAEYSIANRALRNLSLEELRRMRSEYQQLARSEARKGGKTITGVLCDD